MHFVERSEWLVEGNTMIANPLIGTWRLISCENRTADGQVTYPFGRDAVGYLMYNQDGYMFAALMPLSRRKFAAGDIMGGTSKEKATATETFMSYCGRYEFQGDTVIHHVELSLFPNWVGGDQERLVELSGNQLTLSTRPFLVGGRQQSAHLSWERVWIAP